MPTMMVGMRETGPFSCPWQLSLGGEGCCWYSTPALLQPADCSLATKSRMSEGRRERKGAPNKASKRRWRSSRAPGTQYVHTASRAHTPRPSDTHPDAISPRSEAPCHAQPCEPAGAPPSSSALLCDDGASPRSAAATDSYLPWFRISTDSHTKSRSPVGTISMQNAEFSLRCLLAVRIR
jgi:hypothetical protein